MQWGLTARRAGMGLEIGAHDATTFDTGEVREGIKQHQSLWFKGTTLPKLAIHVSFIYGIHKWGEVQVVPNKEVLSSCDLPLGESPTEFAGTWATTYLTLFLSYNQHN